MRRMDGMKWFKPIPCDNTVKDPLVCDFDSFEEHGFNEEDFRSGQKIGHWNKNIFMQAKKKKNDGDPDDALQNYRMIPIYSERLIQELNKKDITGIQYLPIKIMRPNNICLSGFCIANFLNYVDAFDYERSVYDRFSNDFPNPNVRGEIAGILRYVLKEAKLKDMDVIRLKEYNQSFFVSERFKKIFEHNKFTGYSFKEVELV